MKERQTINERDSTEYKAANKVIKKKCEEAKDEWINANCKEIENLKNKNSKMMHKKIKELSRHNNLHLRRLYQGKRWYSVDGERSDIKQMDGIYTRAI